MTEERGEPVVRVEKRTSEGKREKGKEESKADKYKNREGKQGLTENPAK